MDPHDEHPSVAKNAEEIVLDPALVRRTLSGLGALGALTWLFAQVNGFVGDIQPTTWLASQRRRKKR